ncbi:MAG: hypothetical protein ACRDPY_33985 [Streptosporangiaceae bacterium]
MDLREELPGDRESVRDVHLRAFGDHGRVEHGLVVADLVDALRQTITPASGLSVVAEHGGQVVGHVEPWMTGTLVYAEPFWRYDLVGRRDRSDRSA